MSKTYKIPTNDGSGNVNYQLVDRVLMRRYQSALLRKRLRQARTVHAVGSFRI